MSDLTTKTPVEIDTALAEIYGRYYAKADEIARMNKHIEDYEQGLAKKAAGSLSYTHWSEKALEELIHERAILFALRAAIMQETRPYDGEFSRRGGWTRFFLVRNNGGHIHSSMNCSTCFPTTQFGWLPEISGQTEAEAVAAHGAILCTVCYPSAPTEYTDRHDDSVCPGSGKYYDSTLPHRSGYYSGNWATCSECGEHITISKPGKIRKHKRAA